MVYSLYLGSGPIGQIEIFSANCKKLIDLGSPLDKAVEDSYKLIKKLSLEQKPHRGVDPFTGYGNPADSTEETLSKFHPLEIYEEYARQIIPNLSFPLVAVEGKSESFQQFGQLVRRIGLEDLVIPKQMRFVGSSVMDYAANYDIDPNLPNVCDIIQERGSPQIISGAHFLSIAMFWGTESYDATSIDRKIPHQMIAALMGNNTKVLFLEEGDNIFDEGLTYRNTMGVKSNGTRNGLQDFEQFAAHFFHLADKERREFTVEIFPKKYMVRYDRTKIDYGQVLVSVSVNK